MLVRDGLHRAGYHAAIRKQQINLNLDYFRLVPCELSLSSPPLVPGSPHDRSEQIEIVKLDELGISKYVPDPRAAVVAELKRRETQALLPPSAA